jgi:Undecaprenyl-phosphate glucose phosphotransferase
MSLTAQSPLSDEIVIPAVANDTVPYYAVAPVFGRRWFSREILEVAAAALRFLDIIELISASFISFYLISSRLPATFDAAHLKYTLVGALLAPLVLHWCGLYQARNLMSLRRGLASVARGSAAFAGVMLSIGLATDALTGEAMLWGGLWLGGTFAMFGGTRLALARGIATMVRRGRMRDVVAVVGAGHLADRLIGHLTALHTRNPDRCPIEVIGIFDDRSDRNPRECRSVTGGLDDLITLGKEGAIDRIVITLPWSAEQRLHEIRDKLQALSIDISLCPDGIAFSTLSRQEAEFGDLPLLALARRPLRRWDAVTKRVEDIVLASVALFVFGPMMCFIALAVKLDSPGPALFRQRRHGFNNREIDVYKFRTMRTDMTDAGGGVQTCRGDARITRLGGILRRTSLDELPQLLNVLKGDMSLVGPRPHPVGMKTKNKLCHEIVGTYAHRHRVKPGITGWAQVNGYRGATSEPEHLVRRVECDLYYIEHWSLLLDLKILVRTVATIVTTDNAF